MEALEVQEQLQPHQGDLSDEEAAAAGAAEDPSASAGAGTPSPGVWAGR